MDADISPNETPVQAVSLEARAEPFSYLCRRCLHCCHDKLIQINPYEVARLAGRLGLSTTAFQEQFTQDGGGTVLPQAEGGACVFLGAEGCTVHPDRPLVCRLYPLGRHISPEGDEWFSSLEPHPLSAGTLGTGGTIADYLAAQDAYPFMQAADGYFFWLCRVQALLAEDPEAFSVDTGDLPTTDVLDMDRAIAEHCTTHHRAEPAGVEDRRRLHMAILERLITTDKGETT